MANLSYEEIPSAQARLTRRRAELLEFLARADVTASRIIPGEQRDENFFKAYNAFRILNKGRDDFFSLSEGEQNWFDSVYRNYRPIYTELLTQLGRMRDEARDHRPAFKDDRSLVSEELPRWIHFVGKIDEHEQDLYRARRSAAREVQVEQGSIERANDRATFERTQGESVAIVAGRVGNTEAFCDLDFPDPVTGLVYNDEQKQIIEYGRMAYMARRYLQGVCGTFAADAFVRFNERLGGDLIQTVGLLDPTEGAPSLNHSMVHVGPRNQPETLIYDNWAKTITNAPNHTADSLHRYSGTLASRLGDCRDWMQVAMRYIDSARLDEIDAGPLPSTANVDLRRIGQIGYSGYRRNSDSPDGGNVRVGMPMNPYGMSANAANYYTPDESLLHVPSIEDPARPPGGRTTYEPAPTLTFGAQATSVTPPQGQYGQQSGGSQDYYRGQSPSMSSSSSGSGRIHR